MLVRIGKIQSLLSLPRCLLGAIHVCESEELYFSALLASLILQNIMLKIKMNVLEGINPKLMTSIAFSPYYHNYSSTTKMVCVGKNLWIIGKLRVQAE
jgi:hypothetical protein